jgi:hypothetical protein
MSEARLKEPQVTYFLTIKLTLVNCGINKGNLFNTKIKSYNSIKVFVSNDIPLFFLDYKFKCVWLT